ncbi:MAG: CRISPR-associated endonuclease Cas6 [Bacteroidota bacterium]
MTKPTHLVKTLTATFDLPLKGSEIPAWRGAFIAMAGIENDLFHNHDNRSNVRPFDSKTVEKAQVSSKLNGHRPIGNRMTAELPTDNVPTEKFYYRYPLVQYRSVRGKAAIFAMNEGVAAFQKILASKAWEIEWEGQPRMLQLEGLDMKDHYLQLTKEPQAYLLRRWLPFNGDNFQRWQESENLHARVNLLERILPGQLLNFCSGAGWQLPGRFDLQLQRILSERRMRYHDVQRISLDVEYTTNLLLPAGIALGKAVSHGFGCNYLAGRK